MREQRALLRAYILQEALVSNDHLSGLQDLLPLGPAVYTELEPLEKVAMICRVMGVR